MDGASVDGYRAPLFVAWQLSNRCTARCLACCEESGPDAAWVGELTRGEALALVRRIIDAEYARATKIIAENMDKLDAIAEALLERETLGREEIEAIMSGKELPPSVIVSVPTYAEKRRESEEKKQGTIFQPRPREVPSAG